MKSLEIRLAKIFIQCGGVITCLHGVNLWVLSIFIHEPSRFQFMGTFGLIYMISALALGILLIILGDAVEKHRSVGLVIAALSLIMLLFGLGWVVGPAFAFVGSIMALTLTSKSIEEDMKTGT